MQPQSGLRRELRDQNWIRALMQSFSPSFDGTAVLKVGRFPLKWTRICSVSPGTFPTAKCESTKPSCTRAVTAILQTAQTPSRKIALKQMVHQQNPMAKEQGGAFCSELRHPKEGHFSDLSPHLTPAFRPAHQSGGPHSSYAFLGSSKIEGECEAFRTGGVSHYPDARVETANAKASFFITARAKKCPPRVKKSLTSLHPSGSSTTDKE